MTCKEAAYSNEVYDYITDYPVDENWNRLGGSKCFEQIDEHYGILYLNRREVPAPGEGLFEYQSIPKLYGLTEGGSAVDGWYTAEGGSAMAGGITSAGFDPAPLIASGILKLQRPPLQLTGKGVITCLIDTGIDYTAPVFFDEYGRSRIMALWDQTVTEGIPPKGFSYGAEYKRSDIEEAMLAEDPYSVVPSRDFYGHGTELAAVMGGSAKSDFTGAAPEADLVIVKLKEAKEYLKRLYMLPEGVVAYQENDIMLGVKYCESFVELFRRPVVICLALGTNMGDHSGSSALGKYLSEVAVRRNRSVVVGGGSEGNAAHHYEGKLKKNGDRAAGISTEVYEDVEIRVEEGNTGFFLELWGNLPDVFTVSLRSPGGETLPPVRAGQRQSITYRFIYERSRVSIDVFPVESSSGEELLLFRFEDPTPGIWTFRVSAVGRVYNGEFHMWLPLKQFLNRKVYFLRAAPYMTMTEPAIADHVIGVSFYDVAGDRLSVDSGRGYGRTGMKQPNLAAPGVQVSTPFGKRTGSGYGAAITAGAIAQFLQWAVVEGNQLFAENTEIRSYLIKGAKRDPLLTYPNREWGYGRLDLEGVFDTLAES